jgi:glycosyltransferase involved in cell wall biosynthesis
MDESLPRVSVLIPSLGREEHLRRSVAAARGQRGVEVQVVVALDGATGDQDFLQDVTVLASPTRRGVAGARNAALQAADGDWVAVLDDDDVWAPDKLARQVAAGGDFAYASAVVLDEALRPVGLETAPPVDELRALTITHNPIPACASNLLVRRDLAREIAFDPELSHFADWDFATRLIAAAKGAVTPDLLVAYVHHDAAMHVSSLNGVEQELERFRAKHPDVHTRNALRWIASGHRKARSRRRAAGAYTRAAIRHRSAPDLVRAAGTMLGERAMRLGRPRRSPPPAAPDWLALYR